MKITLRKANAIQANIHEEIKSLELESTVALNEFESAKDQVEKHRKIFFEKSKIRKDLLEAIVEIRKSVASANHTSGINNLLTELAFVDKEINFKNNLIKDGNRSSYRVLEGKIKKASDPEVRKYSYGLDNDLKTSILDKDEIEELKIEVSRLKKDKQKIQDRLLELNIQNFIELSENTCSVLTSSNII